MEIFGGGGYVLMYRFTEEVSEDGVGDVGRQGCQVPCRWKRTLLVEVVREGPLLVPGVVVEGVSQQ